MRRHQINLSHIITVATSLGPLLDQVVFVGGAIVGLLITDPAAPDVRPTDDVDVIVEVATYGQYAKLQAQLRRQGFSHDKDGPNCRFLIHGLKLDVMPTDEKILGFKNKWYLTAAQTANRVNVTDALTIRLITAPVFICTKLDAFFDRGKGDYIGSHDLEDIITLVDSRQELIKEAEEAPPAVRSYINRCFSDLLDDADFRESIEAHLPPSIGDRLSIVLRSLEALAGA